MLTDEEKKQAQLIQKANPDMIYLNDINVLVSWQYVSCLHKLSSYAWNWLGCCVCEWVLFRSTSASVPGASNKMGESDWVIDYAIFLHGLAQQWRLQKKQNLAQR